MRIVWVAPLVAGLLAASGCDEPSGCLRGETGCRVASPCEKVAFACDGKGLEIRRIQPGDAPLPGGTEGLGAVGDVLIGNDEVVAVIAGIGNQNYLDPSGGSLIDLGHRLRADDNLNQVLQVVGILPEDSVHYTSLTLIDESPLRVAVQADGTLYKRPNVRVHTRYEIRSCEPGVRIRTEIVNGTPDAQLWTLSDGFYWSGRSPIPFTPGPGAGFVHPSFGLLDIDGVFRSVPFLAAARPGGDASYAVVGCNQAEVEGFQSAVVSSAGIPRTVVPPGDYQIYERFLAVAPRADIAAATDLALELRRQLYGQPFVTLRGRVPADSHASLYVYEGTPETPVPKRIPWTQIAAEGGAFSARLPSGRAYVVEVHAFGRKVSERVVPKLTADHDLGEVAVSRAARLELTVAGGVDAEVFVVPVDAAARDATAGSFHGQYDTCAPWLGPPPGGSPACNRLLVRGTATVEVPPGRYHVYATHGPFFTLARQTIEVADADLSVTLTLAKLDLVPAGALSADLHVHGAASFDSSIPDEARVLSFAAADMDVIIATDHDVVYDYTATLAQLGLADRMVAVAGVETTGHIPWMKIPGSAFPLVIGHYNFWPLRYQPEAPRNGGPFDEFIEPGLLFARVEPLYTGLGIAQLNHPWAATEFGRDLGFPRALALDTRKDLPASDDGTSAGMYVRTPAGGLPNTGHHAQEVMNGTANDLLLAYRAFWFYSLNQGLLRTGTANSDSHSLTDNTIGTPRNLVTCNTAPGPRFELERFDQAIRDGAVLGTNGPIIRATIGDVGYGLAPFRPAAGALLKLEVSAAPWVPVEEIRIIVNGKVVRTLGGLAPAPDPFGTTGLVRFVGEVPLAELLPPGGGDAWLVVEAGAPLLAAGDLGGGLKNAPDGIPDTTDNNGDGKVDQADVAMGERVGPLANPPRPPNESDPRYHFAQILDGSYPFSFTNPFVLDVDGNGRFDAPRSSTTAGSR